jgi:[acyl-carrier-protein] S-malonyltransferase
MAGDRGPAVDSVTDPEEVPTISYAVLFPGQGSQTVGMGAELFEARPDLLGDAADAVLGWSLREVCLDGPQERLTRTEHAQPALYAVSYALWQELSARLESAPGAAAGHSLGEYTALAAAGSLTFADGLGLVAARGRAMAEAADMDDGGMAALVGTDLEVAERVCAARRDAGGRLWVANVNAPGQVVVAGAAGDIEWLVANARDHGVRRAIPLDVAGAFHSPLMAPAAEELGEALERVTFGPPRFEVWANATAAPHGDDVAGTLAAQLTGTVRFAESLQSMATSGIERFVHVGPGDVTAGLARKSVEGTEPVVVSSLEDIDGAVEMLSAG